MAALSPGSHRSLWRLHFLVGLLVAPILMILACTGAVYLFDREIQTWWNRDFALVTPHGSPRPLPEQEAAVRAAFPGAMLTSVALPRTRMQASVWEARQADGRSRSIFVDPFQARVTGAVDPAAQPLAIVRRLHAGLMLEPVGRYLVELAAGWVLVMLLTGLALWWPRRWRLAGVATPRLGARGRTFWRDVHAVPAAWTALMLGFLVLSGMPWSVFWGAQFAKVGSVIPFVAPSPNFGAAPPARTSRTARQGEGHAHHHASGLPWTLQHIDAPMGSGGRDIGLAELAPILARFDVQRWGGGVRIFYPQGPQDVFWLVHVPDKAEGQRSIFVDPGTGAVLRDIGFQDYSPGAKLIEWGVQTHEGREYGLANQLFNAAACLAILGFVVSGLLLWWLRRPRGEVGVPERHPEGDRLPTALLWPTLAVAVLFPWLGCPGCWRGQDCGHGGRPCDRGSRGCIAGCAAGTDLCAKSCSHRAHSPSKDLLMRCSTLLALALLLSTAPVALAQTAADAGQAGCGNSYTIARGDTLGRIAQRCSISLSALRSANPGAQPRRLRIGAQLSLPGGESQGDAAGEDAAGGGATYTIRTGDTLGAIARRNNISLRELMRANSGIQPKRLRVGQVIQMPNGAGATVANDTGSAGAPSEGVGATPDAGYGAGSSGAESGAGSAASPADPAGGDAGYGTGAGAAAGTGTTAGSTPSGNSSATDGSSRATPPAAGAGTSGAQTGATLNLSPAAGPVGTPVELRGEGFQPGERVSLRIGAGQQAPAEFATVEADPQGRIGVRVAVPQGAQPSQRLTFAAVGANGAQRSNTFLVSSGGTQQPSTAGQSPSSSPNGGPTTEPRSTEPRSTEPQSTEPQSTPEQRSPGR